MYHACDFTYEHLLKSGGPGNEAGGPGNEAGGLGMRLEGLRMRLEAFGGVSLTQSCCIMTRHVKKGEKRKHSSYPGYFIYI